jgi:hypothetical protein
MAITLSLDPVARAAGVVSRLEDKLAGARVQLERCQQELGDAVLAAEEGESSTGAEFKRKARDKAAALLEDTQLALSLAQRRLEQERRRAEVNARRARKAAAESINRQRLDVAQRVQKALEAAVAGLTELNELDVQLLNTAPVDFRKHGLTEQLGASENVMRFRAHLNWLGKGRGIVVGPFLPISKPDDFAVAVASIGEAVLQRCDVGEAA